MIRRHLMTPTLILAASLAGATLAHAKDNAAGEWAKRAAGAASDITKKNEDASSKRQEEDARDRQETGAPEDKAEAAAPADMSNWKQHVISPIFSELVSFTMPGNFVVRFENTKNGAYIREAVPKGESVEQWTEMITVTGTKDLADAGVEPTSRFDEATQIFKRACPETFASKVLEGVEVADHETYAAVASCGSVPGSSGAHSETTAFLIIKGAHDYYSVQWAVRGKSAREPLTVDAAEWQARIAKLQPVLLCARKAGDKPPYPDCITAK